MKFAFIFSLLSCVDIMGCHGCGPTRANFYIFGLCLHQLGVGRSSQISLLCLQLDGLSTISTLLAKIQVFAQTQEARVDRMVHGSIWISVLLYFFCICLHTYALLYFFSKSRFHYVSLLLSLLYSLSYGQFLFSPLHLFQSLCYSLPHRNNGWIRLHVHGRCLFIWNQG